MSIKVNKKVNICLSIFICILFLFNTCISSETTGIKSSFQVTTTNTSISDQSINATSWFLQAEQFGNFLLQNAYYGHSGIYWKRMLDLPESAFNAGVSQVYYGYYYGAAGIGDQFLNLYLKSSNSTFLNTAIETANFILNTSVTYNGYPTWYRSADSLLPYTGLKYGYAGIVPFFIRLSEISHDQKYLIVAQECLDALMYYSFTDPTINGSHWGYNIFTNVSITGMTYGAAGIGTAFLVGYQATKNTTYLQVAERAANWILKYSQHWGSGNDTKTAIIYSDDPTEPYNYAGLFTGAAGVGKFFLDLYNSTFNQMYLTTAEDIGRWLISTATGGYWSYGGYSEYTDLPDNQGTFTGLAAGSAGIGLYFLELYQETNNLDFLYPINLILHDLNTQMRIYAGQISWTEQIQGYNENVTFTGLGLGVAGVGMFYAKLYSMFGNYNNTSSILEGINNFFQAHYNSQKERGIPDQINGSLPHYQSDYADGIAGILDFYLSVSDALNQSSALYPTTILPSATKVSFNTIIPSGGLAWGGGLILSLALLISMFTLISIKRKYHK